MVMHSSWYKTFLGKKREPGPAAKATNSCRIGSLTVVHRRHSRHDPNLLNDRGNVFGWPLQLHPDASGQHVRAARGPFLAGNSTDGTGIDDDEANTMLKRIIVEALCGPERV
jgi:hypothetical protein